MSRPPENTTGLAKNSLLSFKEDSFHLLQFINVNHLKKHFGEIPESAVNSNQIDIDRNFMLIHDLKIIATSMGMVQYACLVIGCITVR